MDDNFVKKGLFTKQFTLSCVQKLKGLNLNVYIDIIGQK